MAMPLAELLFHEGGAHDRDAWHAVDAGVDASRDAGLIARVRGGDPNATEELFRAYYPALVHYARRFSASLDAAEDLAQDTFVQFFEQQRNAAPTSELPRSVAAMLRTMVRRRAINEWKHVQRIGRVHEAARADEYPLGAGDAVELPDIAVERAEIVAAVRRAFEALPPRARLIATMRWGDGLGRQEIAAELRVSVRTVDAQLYLVAGRIRESLEPFR